MIEERGTGFVLRTWPLRESDLVVSAFTLEHGKVRGVAHRARSPKGQWAGALEPMTEVSLSWRSREGEELASLTEVSIVRSPYAGRPDLGVWWTLAFLAELIDESAPPRDPDEVVHRLARQSVAALLEGTAPLVVARYAAAWVLRLHGVLPDLAACATCGRDLRPTGGTWHWSLHGVGCPSCRPAGDGAGPATLPDDLEFFENVRRRRPQDVPVPPVAVLRRSGALLRALLREFLGKDLRSERFLGELEPQEAP